MSDERRVYRRILALSTPVAKIVNGARYSRSEHRTFKEPIGSDCRDNERAGYDDGVAIPRGFAEPVANRRKADEYHKELAKFDADIEAHQRRYELPAGQSVLGQDPGKPEPVQQPEQEHDKRAPFEHGRADDVFNRHVDDRGGNDGLDDLRRDLDVSKNAECQSDGVGQCKGADLPLERAPAGAKEKQSKDKQDMIQTFWQNMIEPHRDVAHEGFARRLCIASRKSHRTARLPAIKIARVGI